MTLSKLVQTVFSLFFLRLYLMYLGNRMHTYPKNIKVLHLLHFKLNLELPSVIILYLICYVLHKTFQFERFSLIVGIFFFALIHWVVKFYLPVGKRYVYTHYAHCKRFKPLVLMYVSTAMCKPSPFTQRRLRWKTQPCSLRTQVSSNFKGTVSQEESTFQVRAKNNDYCASGCCFNICMLIEL